MESHNPFKNINNFLWFGAAVFAALVLIRTVENRFLPGIAPIEQAGI